MSNLSSTKYKYNEKSEESPNKIKNIIPRANSDEDEKFQPHIESTATMKRIEEGFEESPANLDDSTAKKKELTMVTEDTAIYAQKKSYTQF